MLEGHLLATGLDFLLVCGRPAEGTVFPTLLAPRVANVAVHDEVCAGAWTPVDGTMLEGLESATRNGLLTANGRTEAGFHTIDRGVLLGNFAMNSVGTFVLGPDDVAALELLNVVSVVLNRVFRRVAQATAFPALGAPCVENVLRQSTGTSKWSRSGSERNVPCHPG